MVFEGAGEGGVAGGSIAVAEDEISGFGFCSPQAYGAFGGGGAVWHGVAIDVVDAAEIVVGVFDQVGEGVVVGAVICVDAVCDFFLRKL